MKNRVIFESVFVMAGSIAAAALFHLSPAGYVVLCVAGVGMIPLYEKNRRRGEREKKEFEEVTSYMEQLLCSYKRWGQLGSAWEDCRLLFDHESQMGQVIEKALCCLKSGEGVKGNDIAWSACSYIHNQYDSRRLILLHDFLCRAGETGGDMGESLDILLNDLQLWKRRKSLFQARKRLLKMESGLSVVLAACMCCFSRIIMPFDLENRLVSSVWYQVSSAGVLCLLLFTLLGIFHKLTGEWLDAREKTESGEEQEKQYQILQSYSRGWKWQMAKRICRQEVEQEFSYWLLSVILYLQRENVYQALRYSLRQLQGVFREEVQKLLQGIYNEPSSLLPYMEFFKKLEMEEIQSGMKVLYSAGNSEYQDTRRQVHFLVEQNSLIMDRYEQSHQDAKTAGMGFLRQIPLLLAAGKVIVDMGVLLVMTMEQYSVW